MIPIYRCKEKKRDPHNNNTIKQYILEDIHTHQTYTVNKDELKTKMTSNQVRVTNLQIDSQGRLVDKQETASNQHPNLQSQSRNLADMTNRELKEYIDSLSDADKLIIKRIVQMIREVMNRCTGLSTDINSISDDIQQLQLQLPSDSTTDTVSQVQSIQDFLIDNQSELGQIKSDIQNISSQIANLSASDTEENTVSRSIVSADGKFEMPEDEYSKYYYGTYFTPSRATNDIQTQLCNYDSAFSGLNITSDIIDKLQQQIAITAEAYYKTEEFYNAQYEDYASNICGSQVLALATDTIADRFKDTTKMSPAVAMQIGKELSNNLMKLVPFKESEAKYNQSLTDFKSRNDLTKEQANKLMTEMGGIWNCAVEFIANNPEWEVMLYVIQTMNHMHLKTYKVGENFNHDTVINDKGTMKSYIDTSLTDKHSNKLTEYSLKQLYENLEKRSAVQDKQYECIKKIYDRFVISYFASKKLLYEKGFYPFSDTTTKEVNGAVVALTEIGLYLSNVSQQIALNNIESFIVYNNNKRLQQYGIKIPTDLSRYIG